MMGAARSFKMKQNNTANDLFSFQSSDMGKKKSKSASRENEPIRLCTLLMSVNMSEERDLQLDIEALLKDLPLLLQQRSKGLDEREDELDRARKAFEQKNPVFGAPSDVLTLNVGGRCMSVLRRTLTCVKGSMLATRFSGRWDDSLEKDPEGHFFIDQNFERFELMIDHLRSMQNETSLTPCLKPPFEGNNRNDDKQRLDFMRMVEYYGLTRAVYPVEFSLVEGDPNNIDMVCEPDNYNVNAREPVKVILRPESTHARHIRAFKVTLGSFSVAKIGWRSSRENKFVVFDCKDCVINCSADASLSGTVHGVTIEEGSVLRFEADGNKWFVDGQLVAYCDTNASNVVQMKSLQYLVGNYPVAYIELNGTCHISAVEQEQ